MPLPVTEREKNACPIAQIQIMGSFSASQRGVNIELDTLPRNPAGTATRTARIEEDHERTAAS